MRRKIYRIIFLILAFPLSVGMAMVADINPEQKQLFHNMIAKYMEYFNSRDSDGILSMYADDALIKTKIKGEEKFITKKEYTVVLPDDIKEWKKKKRKLVDFKIEDLQVNGDVAIVEIEFRGKQGIFSGRIKGNIEARKIGPDWKIILDEF